MNTIELKQELINRISKIEDVDFLNAIKTILDYKKTEPFIELTSDQENESTTIATGNHKLYFTLSLVHLNSSRCIKWVNQTNLLLFL